MTIKKLLISISFIVFLTHSYDLYAQELTRAISFKKGPEQQIAMDGEFKALLIGINKYRKCSELSTPVNDVTTLSAVLMDSYGFNEENITLLKDEQSTRANIEDSFYDLTKELKTDDSLLIYYAGHGQYDSEGKLSWWVPVDGDPKRPGTMISAGTIRDYIKSMRARHILIVSDSCFSGSLFGSTRSTPPVITDKFYKEKFSLKSRWGFTSGNLSPVSDKGGQGHSIFAENFIRFLQRNSQPYLTTNQIYTGIAPIVRNNSEQLPLCKPLRFANDCGGEFIFFRKNAQATIQPTNISTLSTAGKKTRINAKLRFIDNGDGTVLDTKLNLLWEKNDGQRSLNFKRASAYCKNLSLANKDNWRIPTFNELTLLYEGLGSENKRKKNFPLDFRFSPFNWNGSYYWSSSKGGLWTYKVLNFQTGKENQMGKSAKIRFRAVSSVTN